MTSTTSPSDTIRLKSRLSVRALTAPRPASAEERPPPRGRHHHHPSSPSSLFASVDVIERVGGAPPLPADGIEVIDDGVQIVQSVEFTDDRHLVDDGDPRSSGLLDARVDSDRLAELPPLSLPARARTSLALVRAFDLTVAVVGLILLAPLMALVALAVVIDSPGPVFYGSTRLGPGGTTFRAWKFRSMRPQADRELALLLADDAKARNEYQRFHKLRRDPRLTRIGAVIRQGSLDELPQLVNILVGEMSVVGPRPKLARDAEAYGHHLETVLSVKPGLTGLWQVSGRNRLPMAERVALDLRYLEERSLAGDLLIVLRTFVQLWRPRKHGAY